MKLALIGLANSGKTTLFNALTGQNVETTVYATTARELHRGVVKMPDVRLNELARIFKPKKTTYATVEYTDFLGLTKDNQLQNRAVVDLIKDADALVHVVRAFEDDSVAHPFGSIDPQRDFKTVEEELLLADLELIEKRLVKMEEATKKGKKPGANERKVLIKFKDLLEKETPLRHVILSDEELKSISHLQFISIMPVIVVINISENDIESSKGERLKSEFDQIFRKLYDKVISSPLVLSGKIEMEISQLSPEDADAFLKELGIKEPAKNLLICESYERLGLISFFTTISDEVRAWTLKKGETAQKAAGKVHSDIERGFIRAEVVSFSDFITSGSMSEAKKKGLVKLEGKTYTVQDGDIINFRFNV